MNENEQLTTIRNNTFLLTKNADGTYTSKVLPNITKEEGVLLRPTEAKLMGEYPSKSDPTGPPHRVFFTPPQGFHCTCIGFSVWHNCWHVKDVLGKLLKEVTNATNL